MAPSKAIQKKEQAARKRARKAKVKQAKEERLAREHEEWVAAAPERERLTAVKAKKDAERRARNPNPMVSRYSHKYPFPGATKSRNRGHYDPSQFSDR